LRVRHRHIIYIQGYDPRGLAQYYRMFRTELRKFSRLYHVNATISRPKVAADDEIASWTIETKAADWQTRTDYDFLRFEDFIQKDLAQPIWRIVVHAVWIYLRLIVRGTALRFFMTSWRFATFITWPHLVMLAEALCVGLLAWGVEKGLDALGVPHFFNIAVATAVFVAAMGTVLKYTEKRTYVLYLLSDTIWTWQFSHRQRPDWDQRIDRFAQHLVNVARSSDAQEIVLVGHSSGSFLGVELLARALKLDPSLGRRGPRVVLLTIGANFPIVGYHKAAQDFRDHLRDLAVEPSIDWIDCQARKDVMNFFQFDPLAAHGIDVGTAARNPTIVPVRFREIIRPENYNAFRRKFFRVHFQFVMANQVPHAYDFFMIVAGPVPLSERMAAPEAALAVATGDAPAREFAWRQIENSRPDRAGPAETDAGELSARRRG
jgi:pimeloyl-ACP methyl ester carboxylesterase